MAGSPAGAPVVRIENFAGPLDLLLDLARAQKIDLGRIAIAELVDPFVAAIAAAAKTEPLTQLGDWLVAASWLTLLKSRLLLPAHTPEAAQAQDAVTRLGERLQDAAHVRALAHWLEARPQRGRDVFARDGPDAALSAPPASGDLLDLLLACFDVYDMPVARAAQVYRPNRRFDLCTVSDALLWLRRLLAEHPEGGELAQLLPSPMAGEAEPPLHARSLLSSTFLAGLELVRQDVAIMTQQGAFRDIHLRASSAEPNNVPTSAITPAA